MRRLAAILLLAAIGFFIFSSFKPDYGHPKKGDSAYYLEHGVAQTGALNIVTAIYLNYRLYDTLGEATVFFCATLGVYMLLRKRKEDDSGG